LGDLGAAAQLTIKARVRIARVLEPTGATIPVDFSSDFSTTIAVGDGIQFVTLFADVNGAIITAAPARSWSSSAPDVVRVSSSGVATGLQHVPGSIQGWPCPACVAITASTDDGTATANVFVTDVITGLPATVRFAHMASSLGPLTFLPSQGEPVVLSFGQWVERPITSGSFSVVVDGLPVLNADENIFSGLVRDGDYLTVYAVAFGPPLSVGVVTATLSTQSAVPSDSGYVRLLAGTSEATAVYLRNRGVAAGGVPDLCYFDLGTVTDYYHRAAGDFDVITSQKFVGDDSVRTTIIAPAGHKFTYVFVGDTKATLQVIALPDP
jgi:hypothetical protein